MKHRGFEMKKYAIFKFIEYSSNLVLLYYWISDKYINPSTITPTPRLSSDIMKTYRQEKKKIRR